MATLSTAARACLRSAAAPAAPAVRAAALSTSAVRPAGSGTTTSYTSPFKGGETKGSKIPDFGKYMSKNAEGPNKLFSYFMVGAIGAMTAAGAKSTVQGTSGRAPRCAARRCRCHWAVAAPLLSRGEGFC